MQRSDRVSNIVLIVGMVCATILILALREPTTKYVMQRTDGLADDNPPLTFPQEVPHPMRKKVSNG